MLNNINRHLLPLKGHYFFWNAGTGPVVSYLSVYAKQLGFSSVTVGVIYTILPICGMIIKPLAGAISDKFFCQKKIFLFGELLTAVALMSILFSPKIEAETKVYFSCDYGEVAFSMENVSINESLLRNVQKGEKNVICELRCKSTPTYWNMVCKDRGGSIRCDTTEEAKQLVFDAHVPVSKTIDVAKSVIFRVAYVSVNNGSLYVPSCTSHVTSVCTAECDNYKLNELLASTKDEPSNDDVTGLYQFWVFLGLMIVQWGGQAIVVSVGDGICFGMLGDQPEKFGNQRLFGSLGWGIFSTIGGVLIDKVSEDKPEKDYSIAFYMAGALLLMDFAISCSLKYKQQKMSGGIFRDVFHLLKDIRIIVFLVWCTLVGLCTALTWNFLFWLIEELAEAQGPSVSNNVKTLEGLVQAIQCILGEVPFFFLSGWIFKRIGHIHAMTLVLVALGCRFILYSVIENPWYFLPVELSNGLTFGLFYACMASYASIIAPPGMEATMQGLVGAVFEGVGVSLGSLIAGILIKTEGAAMTFRIFGIGALIMSLVHAGVQYILSQKDYQNKYMNPKEEFPGLDDDDKEAFTFGDI